MAVPFEANHRSECLHVERSNQLTAYLTSGKSKKQ